MSGRDESTAALARLGSGSERDQLGFRLIVSTLWRCVALLRPVRSHVAALAIGYAVIGFVVLPLILILFDLFWTRALQGQPLSVEQAQQLGLDPALTVGVAELPAEARRGIARTAMGLTIVGFGAIVPLMMGLYYYQVWILQRVNQRLRIDLQAQLQALSLRFHSDNAVGDAIYRIYQDSAMVTQLIDVLFLTPLFAFSRFGFMVLAIAFFDPRLALGLLFVWPPALLVGSWFSRRLRVGFRTAREANSDLTSRIQETLVGIRVIKAYAAEKAEQQRFEAKSRAAFGAALDARSRLAVFTVAIFWLVGLTLLATTAVATFATRAGESLYGGAAVASVGLGAWNLGLYNAFKFLMGSGTDQVRTLFRTWGRTQDIAIGLDRVFELLDREPEVRDAPDARPLLGVREGVAFRDVHFRYQANRPALEGVDLEAGSGTITAIVGPTGSGKTTLMALLLRLYEPQAGRVEIDGEDIRAFTTESLRDRIAIALQENVLFGATVRDNIRYAVPDASDERVRAAARVACADGFIESLSEGYDTQLGERGTKLSAGQRQRLSIARAVLKDTDVLILDEPTASLDAATELQVLQRLAEWGSERTLFLITHRLSTIRHADRIVVLAGGRVVEQGSHDELRQRPDGLYRRLVEAEPDARSAAQGSG